MAFWKEANKLCNPALSARVPQLLDLVIASNAPCTATKYSYGWNRWSRWAQSKRGVPIIPACPLHIALYLLELTEDALQKNGGCSLIDSALYGIRWAHKVAGLESPAQHPTVVAAAEGTKRKLSRSVQPKQPLTLEAVVRIAHFVSQRKNDQFREGHTSVIARSSKVSCPVAITEKVLALLKDSKESCFPVIPIFTSLLGLVAPLFMTSLRSI